MSNHLFSKSTKRRLVLKEIESILPCLDTDSDSEYEIEENLPETDNVMSTVISAEVQEQIQSIDGMNLFILFCKYLY